MGFESNVSRRTFVSGVAASAALAACATTASASAADAEAGWDEEHEFVVIGAGNAAIGALVALDKGADVVVLEKTGAPGGTLKVSHRGVWIPNNDIVLDEFKGTDSIELSLEYLKGCDRTHQRSEEDLRTWVERSAPIFNYLRDQVGLPFEASAQNDYYNHPGTLVGRSTALGDSTDEDGWYGSIEKVFEAKGLDIRLNTKALHLITDEDSAVTGVLATDEDGNEVRFRGTKGVLIATGSFDRNDRLTYQCLQPPLVGTKVPPEITGDGHIMAMELGVDLGHMGENWQIASPVIEEDAPVVSPWMWGATFVPGAIMVGLDGRRFVNESSTYDEVGLAMSNVQMNPTGICRYYSENSFAISSKGRS